LPPDVRLHCYGDIACWKGREPDQHKKTAHLSGFFVDEKDE